MYRKFEYNNKLGNFNKLGKSLLIIIIYNLGNVILKFPVPI